MFKIISVYGQGVLRDSKRSGRFQENKKVWEGFGGPADERVLRRTRRSASSSNFGSSSKPRRFTKSTRLMKSLRVRIFTYKFSLKKSETNFGSQSSLAP